LEAGEGEAWLNDNARYVGLVADMVGRSLSLNKLQAWQERLNRYFSAPVVEKILRSKDPKALEPRLAEATVMFFDLRGFSKRTEGRNEKILEYLGELKEVMTAMTGEIFAENGVVLQYQGDGILACWNLPTPDPTHVDQACRAALAMVRHLAAMPGLWSCGVGLHGGEVVAGAIGSEQLFNYSVMGAVVNQSSRVEGITKALEVPILVTGAIAARVSSEVALPVRVGRFRPVGMATALDLYELQLPPGQKERNETFGQGLVAFESGNWDQAYESLSRLGAGDRPARFLVALSEEYRRHPPKNWDGVIELKEK
jgi:adenylate cyclase